MENKRLEEIAVGIAREAGNLLLPHYGNITFKNKSKSPADIVTDLDVESERFIAKKFREETPDFGFRGEEEGGVESEKFWLVDPIDGTAHFVRGIPICTTMIALVDKEEVVVGVIFNFVTGEMFSASRGNGAKLNGKPIRVSDRSLEQSYIGVASKLDDEETVKKYLELVKKTTLFRTVSCGFEYGLIASGKIDGRIGLHPYGSDYDFAPGSLLVKEAGGVVANIGMDSFDYRKYDSIATNPVIYKELTQGDGALFPVR